MRHGTFEDTFQTRSGKCQPRKLFYTLYLFPLSYSYVLSPFEWFLHTRMWAVWMEACIHGAGANQNRSQAGPVLAQQASLAFDPIRLLVPSEAARSIAWIEGVEVFVEKRTGPCFSWDCVLSCNLATVYYCMYFLMLFQRACTWLVGLWRALEGLTEAEHVSSCVFSGTKISNQLNWIVWRSTWSICFPPHEEAEFGANHVELDRMDPAFGTLVPRPNYSHLDLLWPGERVADWPVTIVPNNPHTRFLRSVQSSAGSSVNSNFCSVVASLLLKLVGPCNIWTFSTRDRHLVKKEPALALERVSENHWWLGRFPGCPFEFDFLGFLR